MLKIASAISALTFCLGLASNASAGSISGGYDYSYTTTLADSGCTLPSNGTRDYFQSTSGSNNLSADPVTFSICDGVTGALDNGAFTISDGSGDSLSGTFNGTFVGTTGSGGAEFAGLFTITSEFGTYSSVTDSGGSFEVSTNGAAPPASLSGTFDFTTTPEPASPLLFASGLLLVGLSAWFRTRRA